MILYTDIDNFCCEVLRARVADGGLPLGDVWERDVCTLTAAELAPYTQVHLFCGIGGSPLGLKWAGWPAELSIVTGGFPCQDISVAGKGAGIEGSRSGLWKEMHRVIDAVRPRWVIAENVPALRTRGIDRVLGDLERIGYAVWAFVVGADDVGAPHRRKRVWIVGRLDDTAGGRGARRAVPVRQRRPHKATYNADGAGEGLEPGTMEHADEQGERGSDDGRGLACAGTGQDAGGVANPDHRRRRLDEPRRGEDRGVVVGRAGEGVADTQGGGLRADGRARDGGGHADECGACGYRFDHAALGKYGCPNCNGQGLGNASSTGREELDASRFTNQSRLRGWPVAPGQRQHEWEAPRLTQREVGGATDGLPGRLARSWNRHALKALGNSQVPQCIELIGRSILRSMA